MTREELDSLGIEAAACELIMEMHQRDLGAEQARAEEAFHQLNDQTARLEALQNEQRVAKAAEKLGARDGALVARLVEHSADDAQLEQRINQLKKASPYLFSDAVSARGGLPSPAAPGVPQARKISMNQFLRGR